MFSRIPRRSGTEFRPIFALTAAIALLALTGCSDDSSPIRSLSLEAPRTFGYVIGDRIEHRVSLTVARPYALETGALPQPGALDDWLELAAIDWDESGSLTERHYRLRLVYQIFKAATQPATATIPPVKLRVYDGDRGIETETPAWPFSLRPLGAGTGKTGTAGAIRPALAPQPIPLHSHLWLLTVMSATAIAVLLYCAWRYDLLPFLQRHPGPFTRACRALRTLGDSGDDGYRRALRILHRALNETAGETLFLDQLDSFYARHPSMRALRSETEAFFAASRRIFFGPENTRVPHDFPLQRIQRLCRHYRDKENVLP